MVRDAKQTQTQTKFYKTRFENEPETNPEELIKQRHTQVVLLRSWHLH